MNILFVGDVCGKPGRRILKSALPQLIKKTQAEIVIVNGENAAHGKGITSKIYQEMVRLKVDCITLGNHAFSKRELYDEIDSLDRLIRPLNMNPLQVGKHFSVLKTSQGPLCVVNVYGEVFMNNASQKPFIAFEEFLNEHPDMMIFVDLHGEATAEKLSFFHRFKSNCIAICGTHTHVATMDYQIDQGCGYISDVGMTGVKKSILGRDIDEVLKQQMGHKTHYTVAEGLASLNAVVLSIEKQRCQKITPVYVYEKEFDELVFTTIDQRNI